MAAVRFTFLACLLAARGPGPLLAAGVPYLVKDIKPGPLGSSPTSLTVVGDRLFFNADDGVHGQELWVTDGTEAGTYMVIDLVPGPDGSVPQRWTAALNGNLIFQADNNDDGLDLYRSDGTAKGTIWLGEVNDGGTPVVDGSCTFFNFYTVRSNGVVYFVGDHPAVGRELFKTDGTTQGTGLLKDLAPGAIPEGAPRDLTDISGTLFFASVAGGSIAGANLWKSDGSGAGTVMLKDLAGVIWIVDSGGAAFFSGEETQGDEELWVSDGTIEGTRLVKDINPGPNPSSPFELTDVDGMLYFTAFAPGLGREIWKSDGTEEGTQMLMDLVPGSGSSGAYQLTNVDGILYFGRFDSVQGWQLWKSDGTPEGTVLVRVIGPPSVPSQNRPDLFSTANGKLYFRGDDGVHGLELWVSDGTSKGTRMIADMRPKTGNFAPGEIYPVGPLIFFAAGDGVSGQELWAYDTSEPAIPAISTFGIGLLASLVLLLGIRIIVRKTG